MEKKDFLICEDAIPVVVPKRLMIFAGHPDDEILSCGGTILKYKDLGSEIIIVVATIGLGGYARKLYQEQILEQRKNELKLVETTLKAKIIDLNYSETDINRSKVSKITNLIREYKPQVILTPHFSDFHRVHRNLSFIVREAIYHCSSGKAYGGHERQWTPSGVYYYESPSCKFQYIDASVFIIVDIREYWEQKKKIFYRVYESQVEVLERVIEWAESTAALNGNSINSPYGEAYIPETTYTPLKILLV